MSRRAAVLAQTTDSPNQETALKAEEKPALVSQRLQAKVDTFRTRKERSRPKEPHWPSN